MERVGTVKEIWRYPVKSMAGERLARSSVGSLGIPADRGWALRDERAGEVRGAKKLAGLMKCAARYLEEPDGREIPHAEITLPGGERVRTGDSAAVNQKLSALLGRSVTIWPIQPVGRTDFYLRAAPEGGDMMRELREIFGRLPDEPLPDLSAVPPEIMQYTSPLGTYFDVYPLHLMTTASLDELARRTPGSTIDVRRFRPNILIESPTETAGFVDAGWTGHTVVIGETRIRIEMPCMRCVMPTLEQESLTKDPRVLRAIVREANQNLGSYATVARGGEIAVGQEVWLD
jgi:MOSC domain-containing protein